MSLHIFLACRVQETRLCHLLRLSSSIQRGRQDGLSFAYSRFNFDKFLFVGIRLVSTCYIWWHFIHLYKGILEIDLALVKFQCLELISLILYFTCILICIFHLLNPTTFLFWEWEEFEEGKGKSDEAETHAKSRELLENFLWIY